MPDPSNPQALNPYSYVYNNPLRYTDPFGHCPAQFPECRKAEADYYYADPASGLIWNEIYTSFRDSAFSQSYNWAEFAEAFKTGVIGAGGFDPYNSENIWAIAESMANSLVGPGPRGWFDSPEAVFFTFFTTNTLLKDAFAEIVDQRTAQLGAVLLTIFTTRMLQSPDTGMGGRLPHVIQTRGNKILPGTARALNEYNDLDLHPREWGRAIEALKKKNLIPNNHHGQILENGDFLNNYGNYIDNMLDYLP